MRQTVQISVHSYGWLLHGKSEKMLNATCTWMRLETQAWPILRLPSRSASEFGDTALYPLLLANVLWFVCRSSLINLDLGGKDAGQEGASALAERVAECECDGCMCCVVYAAGV
jgi:hypothetical protein